MSATETIRALLEQAARAASEDRQAQARRSARIAWVEETMTALRATQKRVDEAWGRLFDALPDDLDDDDCEAIPPPPEQAELDAILAEFAVIRHHDCWPRHLHWSDI